MFSHGGKRNFKKQKIDSAVTFPISVFIPTSEPYLNLCIRRTKLELRKALRIPRAQFFQSTDLQQAKVTPYLH